MSEDSMKRWFRTGYQIVVALTVAVPVIVLAVPEVSASAAVVAFAAWVAVVARVINGLEDAGVIPAWLKQ